MISYQLFMGERELFEQSDELFMFFLVNFTINIEKGPSGILLQTLYLPFQTQFNAIF